MPRSARRGRRVHHDRSLHEAKALSDLASLYLLTGRLVEATTNLARADRIAPGLAVSVSVGVALLRPGMTGEELFRAADHNLYQAKRAGRDRVAA